MLCVVCRQFHLRSIRIGLHAHPRTHLSATTPRRTRLLGFTDRGAADLIAGLLASFLARGVLGSSLTFTAVLALTDFFITPFRPTPVSVFRADCLVRAMMTLAKSLTASLRLLGS